MFGKALGFYAVGSLINGVYAGVRLHDQRFKSFIDANMHVTEEERKAVNGFWLGCSMVLWPADLYDIITDPDCRKLDPQEWNEFNQEDTILCYRYFRDLYSLYPDWKAIHIVSQRYQAEEEELRKKHHK